MSKNNNKVIAELKSPSDYLKTYFKEFKYEIDDLFDQKFESEKNPKRKDEIRLIWTEINQRTELFNNKCTAKIEKFNSDWLQKIQDLFENKTIIFLDTKNCSSRLLNGMDSKFILINDEYFTKNDLNEFKKQEDHFEEKELTNEKVKLKVLADIISNSAIQYEGFELYSVMVDEISLNINELTDLYLAWFSIAYINENAFLGFDNLQKLLLYRNYITFINPVTFNNIKNLKELDLACNQLSTIASSTFDSLFDLKVLRLDQNKIKTLDLKLFNNLFKLELLDLSENELSKIETQVFNRLKSLRTLILNKNRIIQIENGSFQSLSNLEKMELSHNMIEKIDSSLIFIGLINIESLHLNHNRLNYLDFNAFNNLNNLKELRLNNNCLTDLNFAQFNSMSNLKELYLWKNKFFYIEDKVNEFKKSINVKF